MQGIDSCIIFSKCMTAQVRLLQYIQKYLENKSGGSLIDNRFLNLRILLVSLSVYILFIVHEKLWCGCCQVDFITCLFSCPLFLFLFQSILLTVRLFSTYFWSKGIQKWLFRRSTTSIFRKRGFDVVVEAISVEEDSVVNK